MANATPAGQHELATLPGALAYQAERRGNATALRQKRLGIWQPRTWQALHAEVAQLAQSLADRGFAAGDTLVLLTHPRAEAITFALAAQWLGGIAAPIDPALPDADLARLLPHVSPSFFFAEDQQQVDRLLAVPGLESNLRLLAFAEGRGLQSYVQPALVGVAKLQKPVFARPAQLAGAQHTAFLFLDVDADGQAIEQSFSHADLLVAGRHLVAEEHLGEREEALAARAFAAGGQARYLLAPWLLTGFTLNFPESTATRDNDRREIGPTLVAGTRETYGRLADLIRSRLPEPGSLARRLVDRALDKGANPLFRLAGYWLVRQPLRDVIGFTRIKAPLLVGDEVPVETLRLFAALGIAIRPWPEPLAWQPAQAANARQSAAGSRLAGVLRHAGQSLADQAIGHGDIQWNAS